MSPIDSRLPVTWHATAASAGLSLATVAFHTVAREAGQLRHNRNETAGVHDTEDLIGGCGIFAKSADHVAAAAFVGT